MTVLHWQHKNEPGRHEGNLFFEQYFSQGLTGFIKDIDTTRGLQQVNIEELMDSRGGDLLRVDFRGGDGLGVEIEEKELSFVK